MSLSYLKPHDDPIDLTSAVQTKKVITDNIPQSKIGQFYCKPCNISFKSSETYLKHLNSKEHNEKVGMSMEVAPTTDEEVIERVNYWENFYSAQSQ